MDVALKVDSLSVYLNKLHILRDLSFELPVGEYMAIVGPNGSGKTTLLKTVLGLISATDGRIKVFGNDISEHNSKISYVPQVKTLDRTFPAQSIELVLSGLNKKWSFSISKTEKKLAYEMLEKLSASHLADKQLNKLSGGELQRVYLARCLITNPSILLLDEPATGIDLVCEKSVNHIIAEYNKNFNTTIIMVTHDWSAAYHHTSYTLLLNKQQVYFGPSDKAFTDLNLQRTFSHMGHDHGIKFGLKEVSNA